jgi:hypothetical protein
MKLFKNFFGIKEYEDSSNKVYQNKLDAILETDRIGYAVIDLLDEYTHKELYDESNKFLDKVKIIHPSMDFLSLGRSPNHQLINDSKDIIKRYLSHSLNIFFNKATFEIMYGTHLLKANGKKAVLNPHQDSSHVDEALFASYYVWVPISFPTPDFGTLEVIPYSHKLDIPYRSLNIPWALKEHEMDLWKFMKKINIHPGQAILFSSRLVHASGLNKINRIRMAANIMIKPVKADMLHFYTDKTSDFKKIEIHKINPDFYYNEPIMERPNGYPLIKTVENTNRHYTLKELNAIFNTR